MALKNFLDNIRQFLELIRFSHTVFALPFALLAATMAWTAPTSTESGSSFSVLHLFGILLAMIGARSAAMAFNRLVDRDIDAKNERTRNRHLPAGKLSVATVTAFMVGSVAVYLIGMSVFLPNYLPLLISLPVLAVLLGYSLAKRFTAWVHFWLGIALGLAPICAWVAIRGNEVISDPIDLLPAVVLGLGVAFWVAGFDMIYACQDFTADSEQRLHSIPVWLGVAGALRLAAVCHLVAVAMLSILPQIEWFGSPSIGLGWGYGAAIAAISLLLIYEHALVRPDDLSRINIAFFNINAVISIGLMAAGLIDMLMLR